MRPVGPKIEDEGREWNWGFWGGKGSKPYPHQQRGLGALWAPPAQRDLGRSPDRPKVFNYFQQLEWPLLTLAGHKKRTILIPFNLESIIVNLVMLCDILVYETKFIVGKSRKMVFTAGKRRGRCGKHDTLGRYSPKAYTKLCPDVSVDRYVRITLSLT